MKLFRSIIHSCGAALLVCLFLTISNDSYSNNQLDSLQNRLKSVVDRSERFETQYQIGNYYYKEHKYDSSIIAFNRAMEIAPKDDYSYKARSLMAIGRVYHFMEDLTNTIKFYNLGYQAHVKAKSDPAILADVLKDLGRAYYGFAKYDSAMVYYMQSKEIYEKNEIMNEDYGILFHYIGSVHKRQGDIDEACEYYHQEIEYGRKMKFDRVIAEGMYLSSLCMESDTDRLYNDLNVLRIYEEMGDERMAGLMYGNVALSYQDIGMLDSSLYWHRISLYQRRKEGGKSHLSSELADIGHLLIEMNRYQEALPYFQEAEELAKQTELKQYIRLEHIYDGYYQVNYKLKKFRPAIEYLKLHYVYKDSARDLDHQQMVEELELSKKAAELKAENALLEKDRNVQEKEKQLAEEDAIAQRRNRNIFMIGGLVLLVLGGFIFIKLRETQRQKVIISVQKKEVEHQKVLVDEKNKDIMDSIHYASTIQQAIISSEELMTEMFDDVFVLYKPRDIVSGDFYWAHADEKGRKLFAVGDCTGHGVPGAMMSMLGSAFLDEIIVQGSEHNPAEILNRLRDQVKNAMSKSSSRDGMDMAFCCIEGNTLHFAGANLPAYILRDSELIEIKGCKQPVGEQPAGEKPFECKTMEIQKGDQIYLFSDGYADQFGGPKGKKFKYRAFRDKLVSVGQKALKEQLTIIEEEFENWKGDLEQVDDVCVVGIKV